MQLRVLRRGACSEEYLGYKSADEGWADEALVVMVMSCCGPLHDGGSRMASTCS